MNASETVRGDLPLARKIFRFTKIEHTAFSLPLLLAGAWIGTGGEAPPLELLVLIVVAAVGARVFGMSFNRIFDRKLDALNPRTAGRELPSGAMTVPTALAVAFTGLAVYLIACAALGGWCLTLSPLPLVPLLGYSLLKRFTPFCHFGIGLCLAQAPLGAFVATTGHLQFPLSVLTFCLFVLFWLSGSDIVYSLMDVESDRKNGVFSLPSRFGEERALRIAALCHLVSIFCLVAVFYLSGGRGGSAVAMGLAGLAMAAMYLPVVPAGMRFFPISTFAGIAAAFVPILATYG